LVGVVGVVVGVAVDNNAVVGVAVDNNNNSGWDNNLGWDNK
jgi:hypothetical protein